MVFALFASIVPVSCGVLLRLYLALFIQVLRSFFSVFCSARLPLWAPVMLVRDRRKRPKCIHGAMTNFLARLALCNFCAKTWYTTKVRFFQYNFRPAGRKFTRIKSWKKFNDFNDLTQQTIGRNPGAAHIEGTRTRSNTRANIGNGQIKLVILLCSYSRNVVYIAFMG